MEGNSEVKSSTFNAEQVAVAYFASRSAIWAGDLELTCRTQGVFGTSESQYSAAFCINEQRQFCEVRVPGQPTFRVADDGDRRYLYVVGQDIADIRRSGSSVISREQERYDWRAIGLLNPGEWDDHMTVEAKVSFLSTSPVELSMENGNEETQVKLVWRGPSATPGVKEWVREVLLDSERNWVPVLLKDCVVVDSTEAHGNAGIGQDGDEAQVDRRADNSGHLELVVDSISRFEWKELNGEFVPTRWHWEQFGGKHTGDYVLEWGSVNTVLDDRRFSKEALKMPSGVRVVNDMTDEPFIEEVTGNDGSAIVPRNRIGSLAAGHTSGRGWITFLFTGFNVSFVLFLVFYKLRNLLGSRKQVSDSD